MEYIKKEDLVKVLQSFINARNCNCSKTMLIERRAFEYCLAIINKVKTIEVDEDNI